MYTTKLGITMERVNSHDGMKHTVSQPVKMKNHKIEKTKELKPLSPGLEKKGKVQKEPAAIQTKRKTDRESPFEGEPIC